MQTMTPAVRRLGTLGAAALLAFSLTACGGGSSDDSTPEQALAAAEAELKETAGLVFNLTSSGIPAQASGLIQGSGTLTAAPAFDGSIVVQMTGLKPTVPVIAVGGVVYAQLPLTTGWQEIDPAEYGAPDPGTFLGETGSLAGLLNATTDLTAGDDIRGGKGNKEILRQVSGTLPAAAAQAVLPSTQSDLAVTYAIAENGELREIDLTGDVYSTGSKVEYSITLDEYGTSPTITAP